MPYIKKLVLNNFKSFAREVEIPFTNSMNVIVGPNGSGKSNISDAICFVLGRLSIKSMRAVRAANLLFVGSKQIKPAFEASVKIVFDNSDKSFPLPNNEVSIERKVKRNGQSIYKINDETKTRQEVIELLSQGSVDPYGFNIVLQGGISNIVKMHSEDRRKVIEDVAGISVYEDKKQKSLRELEKTEEKLKEVSAILRERGAYLRNLEEERKQALRYKELESNVKKFKASILSKKINEKKKELDKLNSEFEKQSKAKASQKAKIEQLQHEISSLEQEITKINDFMYKFGGIEQENLHNEITELKAELSGLSVKKENSEQKLEELLKKREQMEFSIKDLEIELDNLRKKSPALMQKSKELDSKKKNLEELEKLKKEHYKLKSDLELTKNRLNDKKQELKAKELESNSILHELDILAKELSFSELSKAQEYLKKLKHEQDVLIEKQEKVNNEIIRLEKESSASGSEISNLLKLKKQVSELDVCPVCKSRMTSEHIKRVSSECNKKVKELTSQIDKNQKEIKDLSAAILQTKSESSKVVGEISKTSIEIIKLENGETRKERLKQLHSDAISLALEIEELDKKRISLEKKFQDFLGVEEKYDSLLLDIKDVSSRSEGNVNAEIKFKEMDVEKTKNIIRQSLRDEESLTEDILELQENISEKSSILKKKEKAEHELSEKFQKLIEKRENLQKDIISKNGSVAELRHFIESLDNNLNEDKVTEARINAEIEALNSDLKQFGNIEIVSGSFEALQSKLEKTENSLKSITSVNLRALEVYDQVKGEYDIIAQKAEQLLKEKDEILKIIYEIDRKKKRTFMKTLNEINHHFTENFMRLYTKGQAYLELENPEDPFSGGVDIAIRIAKGKYFDVTSLSGGEQTLIALSLLFAIQKYKPYSFYIFDEIDAALDKRNSEVLANIIKQNTEKGQHIIITHNDALISASNVLYGVSMQDGVSKLISIEL